MFTWINLRGRGHLLHKAASECLPEFRWLHDQRDITEARHPFQARLARWDGKQPEQRIDDPVHFDIQPLKDPLKPYKQIAA